MRAGQHEDINLITLVGVPLTVKVMDKEGAWTAVKALPEHLVVNGDSSSATNHELKSTTHRVVNPQNFGTASPSMPFCHPVPS